MKIPSAAALAFALAPLIFTGCASGPYTAKSDPSNAETTGSPVVLLDKDLRRVLAVDQAVVAQRNANNLLSLQATLRNMTNDEQLPLQVQTLFKDDSGRVLYSQTGSEAPWQSLTLTPGQVSYYTQSALTPEATQFPIRIRSAPSPLQTTDN